MRDTRCIHICKERLRGEKRLTKAISIFIRTSAYSEGEPNYSNAMSTALPNPTDDTRDLLEVADVLLERIWKPGFRYAKAGVILMDFYEQGALQADLFRPNDCKSGRKASKALMSVVDKINHSGLGSVFFAAQGTTPQRSFIKTPILKLTNFQA